MKFFQKKENIKKNLIVSLIGISFALVAGQSSGLFGNILDSFRAIAADGSITTSKSVYEQGEQIKIIVGQNSEYVGCRMYVQEPGGGHAHFFVLPEIPAKGGTYYGAIPSDATLGTWGLILQEMSISAEGSVKGK